jgi:hypothetical protein
LQLIATGSVLMLLRHIGFRRLCLARDMLLESAEAPRPIAG